MLCFRKSSASTRPHFQNPTYSPSSIAAPVQYSSDGPQDITRLPATKTTPLDHTYAAIDSPLESHGESQVPGDQVQGDDGHYEELDEMHDESNQQDTQRAPTPQQ